MISDKANNIPINMSDFGHPDFDFENGNIFVQLFVKCMFYCVHVIR